MAAPVMTEQRVYTNFWEDDSTADPKIVRVLHKQDDETFDVRLPDGTERQVHLHTLGKFHIQ